MLPQITETKHITTKMILAFACILTKLAQLEPKQKQVMMKTFHKISLYTILISFDPARLCEGS